MTKKETLNLVGFILEKDNFTEVELIALVKTVLFFKSNIEHHNDCNTNFIKTAIQ